MDHRIIFSISFVLILIYSSSYCQNDWREGYIIQNSGDTTHGFIDYRNYKSNSQLCYFRNTEKEDIQKLAPDQILGYRYLNSKYYVSKKVKLFEEEAYVFLEFLIKGLANLYYYIGEDEHYFLEKDGQMFELKNSEAVRYVNGGRYLQEKKEYIGLLTYHFQDASIDNDIQNSDFNHRSLIKITRKYHVNVCTTGEECIVFEKNKKPVKVNYGAAYGINSRTLHFLNKLGYYDLSNEFSNYGGIKFHFQNIPGIYERFSLHIGILASSYYFRTGYSYYKGENRPIDEKKYALNIPVMVSYKLLQTKIYPTLEAGASSYFMHSEALKTKNMTLAFGVSINYEYFKDFRVFINARYEKNPGIIRFGGGLLF